MKDEKAILHEFLTDEFRIEEAQRNIIYFMLNENIRSGEYEGNRQVLKKLDSYNFIIYTEDIYPKDMYREISNCAAFTRQELLSALANAMGKTERELIAMADRWFN